MSKNHINVEFVSVWGEGNICTHACLNLSTGEVFDVDATNDDDENAYEHYIMSYIRIDDNHDECYDIRTDDDDGTFWITSDDIDAVRQKIS